MENALMVLADNIQQQRRKHRLTQEELAEKLGVTFQAVSKWENAKSAPDILLLPAMAELFGCRIDELFSRDTGDKDGPFPWEDDDILRGAVCLGRKILQVTDHPTEKITFEVMGDAKGVQSECSITVIGSVWGDCHAGGDATIIGNLNGSCNARNVTTIKSV